MFLFCSDHLTNEYQSYHIDPQNTVDQASCRDDMLLPLVSIAVEGRFDVGMASDGLRRFAFTEGGQAGLILIY